MKKLVLTTGLGCISLLASSSMGTACAQSAPAQQPTRLSWESTTTPPQAGVGVHEPKACNLNTSVQPTRYEALNGPENGDRLAAPRQIAAAMASQGGADPKLIVDVGAYQAEFLEAFLDRFPKAQGLWTASTNDNFCVDKARLARFGDRVSYKMNCPAHDFTDGCVPKNADIILVSWLSSHHTIAGISGFYGNAAAQLPPGGWIASIDHVRIPDEATANRVKEVRKEFHRSEGGPQTVQPVATLDEQLAALKAAGLVNAQVIWSNLDVVLVMAQKK